MPDMGLIPAWAGKTRPGCVPDLVVRAHPRMGGENRPGSARVPDDQGSSPHGRGIRLAASSRCISTGLIPAWAGKTKARVGRIDERGAHPRMGGENDAHHIKLSLSHGSSPHGRGKLRTVRRLPLRGGLIPAWAGKTWANRPTTPLRPTHPRMGGENGVGA